MPESRSARGRSALAALLALLIVPAAARAQDCGIPAPEGRFAVLGGAGLVRHDFGDDATGRDFGGAGAWNPAGPLAFSAGYTFRDLEGTGADPSVVRAAAAYRLPALPFIGRLCIKAAAGATRFADDVDQTDVTTFAAPVGLVFGRSFAVGATATLTPYVSPHVIFATSDSRLFGFDLSASDTGIGAEAGVQALFSRFIGAATVWWNNLDESLGPTAFPPLQVALRVGLVL